MGTRPKLLNEVNNYPESLAKNLKLQESFNSSKILKPNVVIIDVKKNPDEVKINRPKLINDDENVEICDKIPQDENETKISNPKIKKPSPVKSKILSEKQSNTKTTPPNKPIQTKNVPTQKISTPKAKFQQFAQYKSGSMTPLTKFNFKPKIDSPLSSTPNFSKLPINKITNVENKNDVLKIVQDRKTVKPLRNKKCIDKFIKLQKISAIAKNTLEQSKHNTSLDKLGLSVSEKNLEK